MIRRCKSLATLGAEEEERYEAEEEQEPLPKGLATIADCGHCSASKVRGLENLQAAKYLMNTEPIVIRYAHSPNVEVQKAMASVLLSGSSPISQVHFGTRVYRRPGSPL